MTHVENSSNPISVHAPARFSNSRHKLLLLLLLLAGALLCAHGQPQVGMNGDVEPGGGPNYQFMEVGYTNFGDLIISGGFLFPDDMPAPWGSVEYINVNANGSWVSLVSSTMSVIGVRLYGQVNAFVVASGSAYNGDIGLDGTNGVAGVGGEYLTNGIPVPDPGCLFYGNVGINGVTNDFTLKHGAKAYSQGLAVNGTVVTVLIVDTNTVWNFGTDGTIEFNGTDDWLIDSNAQINIPGSVGEFLDDGDTNTIILGNPGGSMNMGRCVCVAQNEELLVTNGAQMNLVGYGNGMFFENGNDCTNLFTDPGTRLNIMETNGSGWDAVEWDGQNDLLVISNGAELSVSGGNIALDETNTVLVTGSSAQLTMTSSGIFYIGGDYNGLVYPGAQFILADGGCASTEEMMVFKGSSASVAGTLVVTNGGSGVLALMGGALNINGTVTADLVSNVAGQVAFSSGTLATSGMSDSNGLAFIVGDGADAADYVMQGGTHTFVNGLVISSNSVLLGCGIINGAVTNYGNIILTNGCDMFFTGAVINYGTILELNGTVHFQSGFVNHGSFVQNTARVSGISFNGSDVLLEVSTISNYLNDVQFSTDLTSGIWFPVTNGLPGTGNSMTITNFGAATNAQRFYRTVWHY